MVSGERVSAVLGGGDGEYAGACADIEDTPRTAMAKNVLQRHQAAPGRAVMAGAERKAGFNLDWNLASSYRGQVMRTMNNETTGLDRRKDAERMGDPIDVRQVFLMEFQSEQV